MMKKLAFSQQKGGVGKTTLAVLSAARLRTDKFKVSVIDRDPQGAASRWAQALQIPCIFNLKEPLGVQIKEREAAGDDLTIIDTSPNIGGAFKDVPTYADLILLPSTCSRLDIEALATSFQMLRELNPNVPAFAILNKVFKRHNITQDTVSGLDEARVPLFATRISQLVGYTEAGANFSDIRSDEIDCLAREIRNHLKL
jgi:chromosome partitioning protein